MAWVVKITQSRTPDPDSVGTQGYSRQDLWKDRLVTLQAVWDSGPPPAGSFYYHWEILDKPVGSTTTLSSTGGVGVDTVTLTPDKVTYSYRLRLTVDTGGAGKVQTFILCCTYSNTGVQISRGWRYPAHDEEGGEANFIEDSVNRQWLSAYEKIFEDLLSALGAGAGAVDGDVTGTMGATVVSKVQGRTIDLAASPSSGYVLQWDGSKMVLGEAPYVVPLTIDTFVPTISSLVEVGTELADVSFTATYSVLPITGTLVDDVTMVTDTLVSPFAAFTKTGPFKKLVNGATATFTLEVVKGTQTKTSTSTLTWASKIFHGPAVPAAYDATFVTALATSLVSASKAASYSDTAGALEYLYFALPASYGTPTFFVGGFEGGFSLVAIEISVTNAHGITQNYNLWRSDNPNLGTTSVVVS